MEDISNDKKWVEKSVLQLFFQLIHTSTKAPIEKEHFSLCYNSISSKYQEKKNIHWVVTHFHSHNRLVFFSWLKCDHCQRKTKWRVDGVYLSSEWGSECFNVGFCVDTNRSVSMYISSEIKYTVFPLAFSVFLRRETKSDLKISFSWSEE